MPEYPALSYRHIIRILRRNKFQLDRQDGSHQQWVGYIKGKHRVVTVIAHKKDYAPKTMRAMIEQSGLTKKEWYESLRRETKKANRDRG